MVAEIKINVAKAQSMLREMQIAYGNAAYSKAAARTINHTLQKVQSEVGRQVRAVYKIPVSEVNKRLFILFASPSNVTGKLYASQAPLPLNLFNPVQFSGGVTTKWVGSKKTGGYASKRSKSGSLGVTVEILKGQRKTIKSAFIGAASTRSSVRAFGKYGGGGFSFNDSQNGPTSALKTKSVFWAMVGEGVAEKVSAKASELYAGRFEHELRRVLK